MSGKANVRADKFCTQVSYIKIILTMTTYHQSRDEFF